MIIIDELIFRDCIHRIDKLAGYVTKEIQRHTIKMKQLNQKILLTRWELLSSIKTEDDNDKNTTKIADKKKTG